MEYELGREKGQTTLALRRCLSCCCQPCLRGGSDPGDAKTGVHAPWMTGAGRRVRGDHFLGSENLCYNVVPGYMTPGDAYQAIQSEM